MPELPEVEAARALIERRGLNRLIDSVDDTDTYVFCAFLGIPGLVFLLFMRRSGFVVESVRQRGVEPAPAERERP